VIQVGDKESFLWARRLVREEGIFCGGSSGTAIAAAMRYAYGLTPERLVVVVLPDSGTRYLSKFYDDNWMRENSFLETEWSETTLNDVLAVKSMQELITVQADDHMTDVIALLKAHDISQVPVLFPDGRLAGLVTEVDLLKHMLENGHVHSTEETVAEIMSPAEAVFPSSAPLEAALPAIMEGQVALVTEMDRPVGILTKIDLLDYMAQRI
jgi:cystathionine beta-synthase